MTERESAIHALFVRMDSTTRAKNHWVQQVKSHKKRINRNSNNSTKKSVRPPTVRRPEVTVYDPDVTADEQRIIRRKSYLKAQRAPVAVTKFRANRQNAIR